MTGMSLKKWLHRATAPLITAAAVLVTLAMAVVASAPAQTAQEPPRPRQASHTLSEEYRDHQEAVWIVACALLIQTVAITLLIKSARRRREADQMLRESEERFRMLAENSQTGIYIVDQKENLRYVNRTIAEIFGYSQDELVGTNFRSLICPDDLERVAENFQNRLDGRSASSHYEVRGLHQNGSLIDIELFAASSRNYRAPSIIGTVLDISSRKRDERNMQQQQLELERMNHTLEQRVADEVERNREKDRLMMQQSRFAAMGEMIGNIAHQWRQPLNMLGMVIQQMQMEQEKGQLTNEVMEMRVAKGMELLLFLSRTIDDFRNFFRPGVEPRPFSLTKAVAKTVDFFEPSCAGHGIKVSVEGKSELMYTGHVNEFSQALLNVLNNARDALLEVGVEHPGISITLHDDSSRSIITVRDNAGGIAPEVIEKIFDPYFTTKEEGKGTGVGLYMAKAIIERHMQGSICVRNVADGAEFKIIV
jgi:two-component system, NtrC family, C4-dicarboxylate transport sensor histidine kinase DctB